MTSSYTFAIGDLHGRFDLLQLAVEEAKLVAGDKPAIFVVCGDFIDRGPQSKEIIEFLMAGCVHPNITFKVIKGNHEDMMVLACMFPSASRFLNWQHNGGDKTLSSYGYKSGDEFFPRKIVDEHIDWLNNLPIYYIDEHRAFVHAGFDHNLPLEKQDHDYMMWIRSDKHSNYNFMDKYTVHGHMQYADGPMVMENKANLDTYAWRYGRLALAVFDDALPGKPVDMKMIEA